MRKLGILLVAIAACTLPSVSFAVCTAIGTVPTMTITTFAEIGVRGNGPGTTLVRFTTTNANFIAAALAAQASHQNVTVTGNAQSCTAGPPGLINGGAITRFAISP